MMVAMSLRVPFSVRPFPSGHAEPALSHDPSIVIPRRSPGDPLNRAMHPEPANGLPGLRRAMTAEGVCTGRGYLCFSRVTPTPNPSPQGGGGRMRSAQRAASGFWTSGSGNGARNTAHLPLEGRSNGLFGRSGGCKGGRFGASEGTPTPDPSPQGGGGLALRPWKVPATSTMPPFPSPLRGGARGGGKILAPCWRDPLETPTRLPLRHYLSAPSFSGGKTRTE